MCAICDAARRGRSIDGAILFCTTFPCHNCTKHIIAAGISKVVYMEPYPKSRAKELHGNEIEVENENPERVSFLPFLGISPQRYGDIFQKGRRKNADGSAKDWLEDFPQPMVEVVSPGYTSNELIAAHRLFGRLEPAAPAAINEWYREGYHLTLTFRRHTASYTASIHTGICTGRKRVGHLSRYSRRERHDFGRSARRHHHATEPPAAPASGATLPFEASSARPPTW